MRKDLYDLLYESDPQLKQKKYETILIEIFQYFYKVLQKDLNVEDIVEHHQFNFWFEKAETLTKDEHKKIRFITVVLNKLD